MSKARVLFVDDEPNVLNAIRRSLREFDVHTAESGAAALRLLKESEPFSVIVSDCRMPEMDGIELLKRVATVCPASIRVMLTGNVDQETAVKAVNEGDVFKFLNKPCDPEALKRVLLSAVRQYELVTAEKDLLEKTVKGSIKVLADLLGIVKPEAFGRTGRLRRMVRDVATRVDGAHTWELDAAVLLSQLGCVNLAEETLEKFHRGDELDANERAALAAHPLLGAELIEQIPRLQRVAKIILYQNKALDGSGFPIDDIKGEQIPLEARVLYGVLRYDELAVQGRSHAAIVEKLGKASGKIDPKVFAALTNVAGQERKNDVVRVLPNELKEGMIIQEDVKTDKGMMLLCHGQEVTAAIREHLVKFQKQGVLTKRILVAVPAASASAAVA